MSSYAVRRLPSAMTVLVGASLLIFFGSRLVPGNPAYVLAGSDATPATVAAITAHLGLNHPLAVQYLKWLGSLFTGNLGHSYIFGSAISSLLVHEGANTLLLAVAAMVLAVILGFAVGIVGAVKDSRLSQSAVTGYTLVGFGVPTYVTAVLLVLVFAVVLKVLPSGGNPISFTQNPLDALRHLAMPAFCLALPLSAVMSRFLMTTLRQVMEEDYIRTATGKGLRRALIILRHALPNALPPVLTVLGLQIGGLLGGTVIIEQIFSWPGIGRLMLQAVLEHDYLVVQDLAMVGVATFIVIQVTTDVAYAALDPRVKLEQ
ncbi:MAG: ABC transporter permease [Acidimicrobiales bacterium]